MSHPTADRPLFGIVLMLGFCLLIPFSDAMAKLLGDDFPLWQLIAVRFVAQCGLLLPIVWATRAVLFPSARVARLTLLRTCLQIVGIGMMFTALRYLPLADAVAIAFVMPFIMLLLGWGFLGEEVGARRLIACAVGFVGTLMVVQPSFAAVGALALLPLGVAVVFAVFMLITRQIAKDIDPVALQASSGLVGLPVLALLWLLPPGAGSPPMVGWIAPVGVEAWLLLVFGLTGAVGHLLMTAALRFAPSATLAPMQYLEIPMATLVGFLFFRDLPNGLAALGILVTIAAGLYIVLRERRLSRAAARVQPGPPVV